MSDLRPFLFYPVHSPVCIRVMVNLSCPLKEKMIPPDNVPYCGFGRAREVLLSAICIEEGLYLLFSQPGICLSDIPDKRYNRIGDLRCSFFLWSCREGYQCFYSSRVLPQPLFPTAYHLPISSECFPGCFLSIRFIEPDDLQPLSGYFIFVKIPEAIEHIRQPPIASNSTPYWICMCVIIHHSPLSQMYCNLFNRRDILL